MFQNKIPSLQILSYNRCQKDYCSEIIKIEIKKKAIEIIIKAYTRARLNPNFCIPHSNIYYKHKSAPCKYPPRDINGKILMTKKSLIRCIISKIKRFKKECWPPIKLMWWNVSAFLNGRIDAFEIPHPDSIIGICAKDEVSIQTFHNILTAAKPSLSKFFLIKIYNEFLNSEIIAENIYSQIVKLDLD